MEISTFLQRPETVSLRSSFLENVSAKNQRILGLIESLSDTPGSQTEVCRKLLVELFTETHRLKGSGGTYGFNEISLAYEEMLLYIRPAHEGLRLPDEEELEQAEKLSEEFDRYLPLLRKAFGSVTRGVSDRNDLGPQVFFVTQNRRSIHHELFFSLVKRGLVFYTVQNGAEAESALEKVFPHLFILDTDFLEGSGISICKNIRDLPNFSECPIWVLSHKTSSIEKEELQKAGATHYFGDPFSQQEIVDKIFETLKIS